MAFETSGQWLIFLSFLYLGAGLYIVYRVLGSIRNAFGGGFLINAFFDALFSVAATVSVLFVVIYKGRGELRGYMLLGAVLGFLLLMTIFERIAFYAKPKLHELKAKTEKKKE
ncbi:MAG: hypothetical protein E7334_05475 [Clostridiales bacterium]|nr:hypothetical protein [Clostridiales bacterium]